VGPVKVRNVTKGLELLSWEERLGAWGLFSLEKRRLKGVEDGARLFSVMPRVRIRGNWHKQGILFKNTKGFWGVFCSFVCFGSLQGWPNTGTTQPERLRSLSLETQNLTGHVPKQSALIDLALSRALG